MRYYGIEVELEMAEESYRAMPPSYWIREGDGSLRNGGVEFKSFEPLPYEDAKHSLTLLHDFFTRNRIEPEANGRCSIHIHQDVRDMSAEQVYHLMCNYSMIEPMFFQFVGGGREESHFCIPYYHAKDRIRNLMHAVKDHDLSRVRLSGRKYMSLNILPMLRFGSVEWRQFPAVLPVTDAIPWLELVDAIKTSSMAGLWSDADAKAFVEEHMPDVYDEDLFDTGMETYYYHLLQEPTQRSDRFLFPEEIDFGDEEEPEEEDIFDEVEPMVDEERMEEIRAAIDRMRGWTVREVRREEETDQEGGDL
jgi:hypothetical protein